MSMTSNRIDPITATYISPEDLQALARKCTAAGDHAVMQSRSDVAAVFHDAAVAVEDLAEQPHHLRLPFLSSTPPADQLAATEQSIEDFQLLADQLTVAGDFALPTSSSAGSRYSAARRGDRGR